MDRIQVIRERLEERRERFGQREMDHLLNEGFSECLSALAEQVEFEAATLYLILRGSKMLHRVADYNGGVNFIDRVRFDHGYGLSAWVAQKQRPIYLPDIHRGSRHGHKPIRSYLSLPIILHDELVGVINFAHTKPHAFERTEMLLIRKFIENLKPIIKIFYRYHGTLRYEEKDFDRR
ncbi:MAG: GAF domain-containing protein [candidate division KSB1 bacterium]|nr:GAF domain-containing protein [candidate division KSB1 bacterium]MDQ7062657.1 GAF domain-containing protein [candidate division KSB1 bacterium]